MRLRRLEEKDLPKLFEWRNDERVWKWCRQHSPLHWTNHVLWYERQAQDPHASMFIAETTEAVGVVGLTDIDYVNSRAEFSCYINPEQHLKGFGRKALKLLLSHAFNELGLNRVWGETFDGNPALKLFKSLGMKVEGTRKEFYFRDGVFIDCHLISVSSAEYFSHSFKHPQGARAAAA